MSKCKDMIDALQYRTYIGIQLMKLDESEQREAFNIDDMDCYTPSNLMRFIALYEEKMLDEQNKLLVKQRNEEVCRNFKSLRFEDEEKYSEQSEVLKKAQTILTSLASPDIRAYDLFCQCVKEPSYEKIIDVVEENIDKFNNIFDHHFSEIERSLYAHRIIFSTVNENRSGVPFFEDYEIDIKRTNSVARSPKPACTVIEDAKNSPALKIVIDVVLNYPIISVDLFTKLCPDVFPEASIEKALEYLYKKGYLVRHALKIDLNSFAFYAVYPSGRNILTQKSCIDNLKIRLKDNRSAILDSRNFTLSEVVRTQIGLRVANKISDTVPDNVVKLSKISPF